MTRVFEMVANGLPVAEEFSRLGTHGDRARWLLSAPLDVISRDHAVLSVLCREAGFSLGEAYVRAELVALTARRRGGEIRFWQRDMVRTLRAMMRQEAGYSSKLWLERWKFW